VRHGTGYLVCATLLFCLFGCGTQEQQTTSKQDLQIVLKIPEGSDSALFWHGTNTKLYIWESNDGQEPIVLEQEQIAAADIPGKHGGVLRFEGRNSQDEVLVAGVATLRSDSQFAILTLERVFK
jgi:hypothetical protein